MRTIVVTLLVLGICGSLAEPLTADGGARRLNQASAPELATSDDAPFEVGNSCFPG